MLKPLSHAVVLSTAFVACFWTPPIGAQEPVTTADVQYLARTIQAEIEAIRWHIGRQPEARPLVPVEDVSIRENFRQAMSLWQKVNQLGIELVGGGEPPPVVTRQRDGDFGPAEVHQVLTSVQARLQEIRDGAGIVGAGGIVQAASEPVFDPDATPSDVFQTIVQSNRQVALMLEQGVQPGDVYQQVLQAVFYASEILSVLEDEQPYPGLPEYEAGRLPGHVYGRLLLVLNRLSGTFETWGLSMLRWTGDGYAVDESLTPSDVYDMATLLLSELEYLHSALPGARAPLQVAHPGLRWPSDVYQQAGVLQSQSVRILLQAQSDPDLLARR